MKNKIENTNEENFESNYIKNIYSEKKVEINEIKEEKDINSQRLQRTGRRARRTYSALNNINSSNINLNNNENEEKVLKTEKVENDIEEFIGIEKRKKKKINVKKIIFIIVSALFLAIIVSALVFWYNIQKNGGGIKGVVNTVVGVSEEEKKNLKPIYTLILGTNEENTDTILLAGYSPQTQEGSLLSIPRDTFVGTDVKKGKANDKINSVYRVKGVEAILEKVRQLTGVEVHNYVVIDTKGVIQLVDAIGGVEFDVPIDMNYHDSSQNLSIELKKGMQRLNGKQAEGLVRFRHNDDKTTYPASYGVEDHGRSRTQREFMKETLKQTIQGHNITKIFELIDVYNKNVKTNLNFDEMKKYVPLVMEFNPEKLKQGKVPGKDIKTTAWFYLADKKQLEEIIFDLFVFENDPKKIEFRKKQEQEEKLKKEKLEAEEKAKAEKALKEKEEDEKRAKAKKKKTNQ